MTRRSLRFVVNGVVATGVNYAVLALLLESAQTSHAGVAGLLAAVAGIAASYLGNRFYVFRSTAPVLAELARFKTLYVVVALVQASFLAVWCDVLRLDYRLGFILITGVSVLISYYGNRSLVFR